MHGWRSAACSRCRRGTCCCPACLLNSSPAALRACRPCRCYFSPCVHCPPACGQQGPSRADMLGGFFKMRVTGWATKEEEEEGEQGSGGERSAPLVVQVLPPQLLLV